MHGKRLKACPLIVFLGIYVYADVAAGSLRSELSPLVDARLCLQSSAYYLHIACREAHHSIVGIIL